MTYDQFPLSDETLRAARGIAATILSGFVCRAPLSRENLHPLLISHCASILVSVYSMHLEHIGRDAINIQLAARTPGLRDHVASDVLLVTHAFLSRCINDDELNRQIDCGLRKASKDTAAHISIAHVVRLIDPHLQTFISEAGALVLDAVQNSQGTVSFRPLDVVKMANLNRAGASPN